MKTLFLLLLSCLPCLAQLNVQQPIFTQIPIDNCLNYTSFDGLLRWPFCDGVGTSVTELSSSNYVGIINRSEQWIVGQQGYGISNNVSASDYVVSASSVVFNTNQLTVAFWAKVNSALSGTMMFAESTTNFNTSKGFAIAYDRSALTVGMHDGRTSAGFLSHDHAPPSADGLWHHYAAVLDGDSTPTITFYFDGLLQSYTNYSVDFSVSTNFTPGRIFLASRNTNSLRAPISFDDFRIYGALLNVSQIAAIMGNVPPALQLPIGTNANYVFSAGTNSLTVNSGTFGGGGVNGRTFIANGPAYRFRNGGKVYRVDMVTGSFSGVTNGMRFKVLRPNGSNFDVISSSSVYNAYVNNTNVFNLTTPLDCREGDIPGIYISGQSEPDPVLSIVAIANSGLNSVRYTSGDVTGSNQSIGTSVDNFTLAFTWYVNAPVIGWAGDSIMAGHNAGTNWMPYLDGGIQGTLSSSIPWCMSTNGGSRVGYMNYGKGSQTYAWVAGTAVPAALNDNVLVLWLYAGGNDIGTGRTWTDVLGDLTTIRNIWPTNRYLYVSEMIPWTAGSDAQALTLRTWNTNLTAWASTNYATVASMHDDFGKIRVSTGFLDDLKTEYDQDGVHITQLGVSNYVYRSWNLYLKNIIQNP